jgi:hypothetical protein
MQREMARWVIKWKGFGSGRGLIKVLILHLPGESKENYEPMSAGVRAEIRKHLQNSSTERYCFANQSVTLWYRRWLLLGRT